MNVFEDELKDMIKQHETKAANTNDYEEGIRETANAEVCKALLKSKQFQKEYFNKYKE